MKNVELTPIMLCSPEGIVLELNPAAAKAVYGMRKGVGIARFLPPEEQNALADCLAGQAKILHFNGMGKYRTAYARGTFRRGKSAILLLFPAILQPVCRDSVIPWVEKALLCSAEPYSRLRIVSDEDFAGNRADRAATGAFGEEMEDIIRPQPALPQTVTLHILTDIFRKTVSEFAERNGCQLKLDAVCLPAGMKRGDFGVSCCGLAVMAVLLSGMMLCTRSTQRVRAEVTVGDSLSMRAGMTYRNTSGILLEGEDIVSLAELFEGNTVNMLTALIIARALGGRIHFLLTDKQRMNLTVELDIPLQMVSDSALHRPISEASAWLQRCRIGRSFAFLLKQE